MFILGNGGESDAVSPFSPKNLTAQYYLSQWYHPGAVLSGTLLEKMFREAGNGRFKTYEEGLQCSKDIKAAGYVESSALLNEGIHNVSIGSNNLTLNSP